MSKMNPLKVANLMADAAQKKSHAQAAPDMDGDEEAPQKPQAKKVAAMKEQEKAKGKPVPNKKKGDL